MDFQNRHDGYVALYMVSKSYGK